jgi:hypothetical protein
MLRRVRKRAIDAKLDFNLTTKDLKIPTHCPVLGIPLKLFTGGPAGRRNFNGPSVDRIDNSKGYIRGNVIVVSNRANILKSDATIEELIAIAKFYRRFL